MSLQHTLLTTSCQLQEYALTIIRIGIGLTYIKHGWDKLSRGKAEWIWVGQQMQNIGISCWPLFWGLAATIAEFGGGILLTLGLATRLATPFMAFTMLIAIIYHIKNKDPWGYISFPLSMLIIFIGFIVAGSGSYSIDRYLLKYHFLK